ncbi:uncharacterized protein LOC125549539 [Triticum urartu]|uniref:uncharacterized protein LOC125549539 n=1 Tax=Triticum urartu TaxID=4572 RepID=UPI00204378F8|nr:uncharacterized protein LOC125549539 [Triticum urartu]
MAEPPSRWRVNAEPPSLYAVTEARRAKTAVALPGQHARVKPPCVAEPPSAPQTTAGYSFEQAKSKKRKEKSKEDDDGGPVHQCKRSICTDSPCSASALQVPSLRSPTPPSKNAKLIKRKEICKALDDGGPSAQLKWRVSTDSTPPSSQQDSQYNAG